MKRWLPQLAGRRYLVLVLPLVALGLYLLVNQLNGVPNHPVSECARRLSGRPHHQGSGRRPLPHGSAQDQIVLRSIDGVRHLIQDLAEHAVVEQWATERQVDTKRHVSPRPQRRGGVVTISDVAQRMHEFEVQVEDSEILKVL